MLHFSLNHWRAVSEAMATEDDWHQWAINPSRSAPTPPYNPTLDFLPPMARRRLGHSARMMLDAAWPLLSVDERVPVVYASHDGEINRSVELWLSLLRDQQVSPTAFGLSVHNALVGQWSMLRNDMSESTALCDREDGFELAMLEACTMLNEGARKVLVLVSDDPLSANHAIAAIRAPFSYAAAFVVEAGEQWTLARTSHHDPQPESESSYWGALDWIAQYLQGRQRIERTSSRCRWQWDKRP